MIAFLLAAALALPAAPAVPVVSMTLKQAEVAALEHSPSWAAARLDAEGAAARAEAAFSDRMPRLTLSAYYNYQAVIPYLSLAPGAPARAFGSHDAYGAGPSLSWTLWDEGALKSQWESQKAAADSQEALASLERRQVLLGVRLAYFQVQLAREQLSLLADSAELAEAEYQDIAKRLSAGAASRLDALSAHQEALSRRREYLNAQASLGGAYSELAALTGPASGSDLTRAGDSRRPGALLDLPAPTFLIAVDALGVSTEAMARAAALSLDPAHPRLAAYEALSDSARLSERAALAGSMPRLQATAALMYEYPNPPVLETIWQKRAGVSLSFPLWEDGRSAMQAEALRAQSQAALSRRARAADELGRDRLKALERLASLAAQRPFIDRSVAETQEISRLTYESYKQGRATFLEVQSANLRAVQAKVERAAADERALVEIAVLASLAPEDKP